MFKRIRPKSIADSISKKAKASIWVSKHSKVIAASVAATAGITTAVLEKSFKLPLSLASTYFAYKIKGPVEVLSTKGFSRQVSKCIGRPRLAKKVELLQKDEQLKFFFNAAGKVSTEKEKKAFTNFLNLSANSEDWITLKRVFSRAHSELQSEISKNFFLDSKNYSVQQPLLNKLYKEALLKVRQGGSNNAETEYEIARITYAPAIDFAIRRHASNITPAQRKEVVSATKALLERVIQKSRFKSTSFNEDKILNEQAEVLVRILGSKATLFSSEAGIIAEDLLKKIMPAIQMQMTFDKIKLKIEKRN